MIFANLLQSASNLPSDSSAFETAISAIENDLKTLEMRSVPWEHSVWPFTAMVVFGLVLEFFIIRRDWRDEMEEWALGVFGVSRLPKRPSITKLLIEIASVLLITIGVAGELVTGIEISSINGDIRGKSAELRSKSDQLVALVTAQSGDAETLSKSAQEKAKGAIESLSVAQRQLADIDTQVASAKAQIEGVAAESKEFEKAMAPRPKVQYEAIGDKSNVDALRKFTGVTAIVAAVPVTIDDAWGVVNTLTQARWNVFPPSTIMGGGLPSGVLVRYHSQYSPDGTPSSDRSKEAAKDVCDLLLSFDWETCVTDSGAAGENLPTYVPPNTINVFVGPKLNTFFAPVWEKPFDPKRPITEQIKERAEAARREVERHLPKN